jgi:predicted metal-dependent hydrolase
MRAPTAFDAREINNKIATHQKWLQKIQAELDTKTEEILTRLSAVERQLTDQSRKK